LHNARDVLHRIAVIGLLMSCSQASGRMQNQPDAKGSDSQIDAPVRRDAAIVVDAPVDASNERYLCRVPPPANSPIPAAPPLPAAGCPTLAAGYNTLTSLGNARRFILVLPTPATPGEKLPVLFLWHWLGGDADDFLTRGDIQNAANLHRFIAVIPDAKGASVLGTAFNTKWPFDITQLPTRMDEEFKFFDDMLACVEQQYTVNQHCVSSIGVSAGALFTDQLAQARSNRIASFVSLSGGVGATIIKPWAGSTRKLPGVVLWGGDGPPAMDGVKDILGCLGIGMDFSVASRDLETALAGHFVVECRHNCGHVEPPFDIPTGETKYSGMWEFALNHPFWLPDGQSPFLEKGLPTTLPPWCSIGVGTSQPRTGGGCPAPENPCVN
jgi:predicted esterase